MTSPNWSGTSTNARMNRLQQTYIHNGGVAPQDITTLKKLLAESGVPVGMSDAALQETVNSHFEDAPVRSSPRGAAGGKAVVFKSVSPIRMESRRRLSTAEYTAVAEDVRRKSLVNHRDDDVDEFLGVARQANFDFAAAGADPFAVVEPPSRDDDGDDDDKNSKSSTVSSDDEGHFHDVYLGIPDDDFSMSRSDFDYSEARMKEGRGVSVRSLHRRLKAMGLPQSLAVIVGDGPTPSLKERVSFRKLKQAVGPPVDSSNEYAFGSSGRSQPQTKYINVTDPSTLFRRLGGDPLDQKSTLGKAKILKGLSGGSTGLSPADIKLYKKMIEQSPFACFTFDTFVDVVAGADMAMLIGEPRRRSLLGTALDKEAIGDGENSDAETEPTSPLSTTLVTSGGLLSPQGGAARVLGAEIAVWDAAAAFMSTAAAHHRRKSNVAVSDRLRMKLAKTLNDHVAKTHRDCTFTKGLVHVLRLDVQLLQAFVLRAKARARSNSFSSSSFALRVLRGVERTVNMLKSHATCQVCYMTIDIKPQEMIPRCGDHTDMIHFMRMPQLPPGATPSESSSLRALRFNDAGTLILSPKDRSITSANGSPQVNGGDPSPAHPQVALRGEGYTSKNRYKYSSGDLGVANLTSNMATTTPRLPAAKSLPRRPVTSPRKPATAASLLTTNTHSPRHQGAVAVGSPRYLSHLQDDEAKLMRIFQRSEFESVLKMKRKKECE